MSTLGDLNPMPTFSATAGNYSIVHHIVMQETGVRAIIRNLSGILTKVTFAVIGLNIKEEKIPEVSDSFAEISYMIAV